MLFKWVKLPSGCVVPGSCVLNVTFACCFVNYWGGLFRWTITNNQYEPACGILSLFDILRNSEYGPPGKEHHARLIQGLWNWQVWAASPFTTSVAFGVIWVQFWLLYLVSSLQYQLIGKLLGCGSPPSRWAWSKLICSVFKVGEFFRWFN